MSIIFRLANRQIVNRLIKNERFGQLSLARPITMKIQQSQPPLVIEHEEKNAKLGRPLSPHLSIYAVQITSLLSISHRFTGIALSAYTIALGIGAFALPDTIPHYIDALAAAKVGAGTIIAGKFLLAFPMTYHFWNGIRHLSWDLGLFLTNKEVALTGYAMLAVSVGSAIALCCI